MRRLPASASGVRELVLLALRPRRGGVGAHRAAAAAAASREDDLLSWCLFFTRPADAAPPPPGSTLLLLPPPLLPTLELLLPESVVLLLLLPPLRPTLNVLDRGDADGLLRGWRRVQVPPRQGASVCATGHG